MTERGATLLIVVLLGAAGAWPPRAGAQTPAAAQDSAALAAEIDSLRAELDRVRREYDERLAALELRIAGLAAAASPPAPVQPPEPMAAQPEPAAAQAPLLPEPMPPAGATPAAGKVFNPDIAVVGNMLGVAGTNAIESSPALEFDEAEASFQAIVDPYARGDVFFAFGPEGVEIEEGFITFNTLPGGLLLKAGKLRGAFGKVNTMHTHALPWADRPLVTRNLLGGNEGISDGGLSLSKLILNPVVFLEATGEVYRGHSEVFAGSERSHVSYVGRLRAYRDLTEGTNLDAGGSLAWGHTDAEPEATRRLIGVDATFRYRPLRRAIYRRMLARTELVWSQDRLAGSHPTSFGMYASTDYQFARRWFVGARYDYSERPLFPSLADRGAAAILTFWPSEYSQIRGQYRHTRYAEDVRANEVLFQFLFSIGAHGGHVF
jgi:hypothetical protein